MSRPLVLSFFGFLAVSATSLYLLSCANPRQRQRAADSYVFRAHDLDELADLLAQAHRPEEADEMRRLAVG